MASPNKALAFNARHLVRLGLLLLVFLVFFYRLGSYPLFDLDEPRYAEAAREMLERGNWITPYFNYELRFDKPVFFYWLIMLAYQLFGVSEFAARFFSAVSATAIVVMIYAFGRHWISERYGLFASLMLATSVLFIGIARMSITDMTLSCFMTGATLCLFMAAHRNLRWWLGAGAFAGLAVLTKGPVGIVVPGAILVIYTLLTGDFKRVLINRWLPLALLVCAAIAIPWYVLAYLENGRVFVDALLLHNVTRYSDVVSGHKQPIYFYAVVLFAGFLPWTPYLPAAIRQLWHEKTQHKAHVETVHSPYLVSLFSAVWIAFIFIFFTLGNTKLLTYILPLFPALALFTANAWHAESLESVNTQRKASRWFTVPAWLLVVAGLIAGLVFITNMDKLLPREAAGVTANGYNIAAVVLLVVGASVTAWLLSRKSAAMAILAQSATVGLLVVVGVYGIVPNVSKAAQGVMMEYLHRTDGKALMLYEIQRPSLTFYGKRRIPRFVEEDRARMIAELNKTKQTYVITKNHFLPDLTRMLPTTMHVKTVEKGPVYSLLAIINPSPSCDTNRECQP